MVTPSGPTEKDERVSILIVDDNPHNIVALEAMLEPLGQMVVRAASGTEALRCLLDRDFALALIDIHMPGLDGFETARLIRDRPRSRHMPLIFLTAFDRDDAHVALAYTLGAIDFMWKPVEPFILLAKVQVLVDLHRKTRENSAQATRLRDLDQRLHDRQRAEAAVAERELVQAALQQSNLRLSLLSDVANRLLLSERPDDDLGDLCGHLADHLSLEVHFHHLLSADDDAPASSLPGESPSLAVEPVSLSVAASRVRVVAHDVQLSEDAQLSVVRELGLDAYACFPLLAHGRLLGTLSFGTRRRRAFAVDEVAMMQLVCDQVAVALERRRLISELSLRNEQLANTDRRKDEFLAMLAHELRNPLAPIVNAVHLLRTKDTSAEVKARAVGALDRQATHMVRLVDDLLDLSRITTGRIELRCERVTVEAILNHAVQTSAPLMEQWKHRFSFVRPTQEVLLFADSTRLCQVLANLLNNAAKYSPEGSAIALEAELDGAEVVVRVRDSGMGIRPDMLEEVFGLFVQAERTAERAQGGLGIGLTLARRLIEMHGGTITAESEGLDQGCVFTVRLPVVPALAAGARAPPAAAGSASPRRVVVVEDDDDIRETMKDMLEHWGHDVEMASDGAGGVETVLSHRPSVAFIDIGLPGLDGYQVATALRQRAPDLATRLIAVTGYGRPEDRAQALAAGFDDHMVKPVTAAQLARLLA